MDRQDWDESDRCEGGVEGKGKIQRVGDREKDNCAGEEIILDIQRGQQRYAGHLLL